MQKTLLVLAAGMGSRYGGMKQMDPIGPKGEFILDYSVGDAVKAGFSRVVFVVRPEMEADFRAIVGRRWEARVEVAYAHQTVSSLLPPGFSPPPERKKPWGTAHAVLCAGALLNGPFAVVNADDYYGGESFAAASAFLSGADATGGDFCMVAYRLDNTLSASGTVSRGICSVGADGLLRGLVERTELARAADGLVRDAVTGDSYPGDTPVSMNLFGFTPRFVEMLSVEFSRFLSKYGAEVKREFQMPTALATMMRRGDATVRVLRTPSRWIGITVREDRAAAAGFFGTIPSPLD
ncbi:MAG: NTP transferase domain-containing protein [Kiritimatiellae bacterium]|nr:NTP transferase domain-containing protein [Kiritimatiellia bacterium]